MEPFLTIIIPVYKIKEEYIRRCLESLLAQDMKFFKVITIDDGSPDNCGAICDEYAAKDVRFSVIHQVNAGVSVARNKGIIASDTEWIAFVDPDDWIEPDTVSTLYKAKNKSTGFDVYLYDYIQEFAERTVVKRLKDNDGALDAEWLHNLRMAPFNFLTVEGKSYEYETNVIWNKMYKASLIKESGLLFSPEARKGQDVIFIAECLQLTDRIFYIKKPLYHYRYIQDSMTNRYNPKAQYYNEVAFEAYERIIKKYNLPIEYWEAFYARVVTRMYSSMRLYYFHEENTQTKNAIYKALDETLSKYPYSVALRKVKSSQLTGTQRVFVYFLKRRQYWVLRLLVEFRQSLKNMRGLKLK